MMFLFQIISTLTTNAPLKQLQKDSVFLDIYTTREKARVKCKKFQDEKE